MRVFGGIMKNWYLIGFGVGLLIGCIILGFLKILRKDKKCEWDEMQEKKRGESFMIGFWTMVFFNTLFGIISFIGDGYSFFKTPEMTNIVVAIIGVGAFACVSIFKDAYFQLHQSKKSFYVMGICIIVVMALNTIISISRGRIIEDGKLGDGAIVPLVLILWIVVFLSVVIHSRKKVDEE